MHAETVDCPCFTQVEYPRIQGQRQAAPLVPQTARKRCYLGPVLREIGDRDTQSKDVNELDA